ncbi:MAG: hypothetical protein P4L81_08315 [Candidatus Pacebacteria bacterium]|nr:hypothetical protein [Candidatus Paceibacterota bacterium]
MKTTTIFAVVIVVVIAIAGWFYYANQGVVSTASTTATSTAGTTGTSGDTGQTQTQPSAPTVVTDSTVAPTNSTAVVTGTVTPNGTQTAYWYEFGTTSNLGSKTSVESIGSGWSPIPSPGYITGLATNTQYYYRLDAENQYGSINGTTYSFSTNNTPAVHGSVPTVSSNVAENVNATGATLTASINPRSSQTTYWFEYGTDTTFGQVSGFQSAGNSATAVAGSATISGLNSHTTYYFRVDAQNQYGTVNGTTQSFMTTGPAASAAPVVTTQLASAVGTTTATLNGTVNPSGTQTTYWFEYSTDSLLGSVLTHSTARQSTGSTPTTASAQAQISSLQPSTKYYYVVVAQNSAGVVRGDKQTFTTK